MFALFKKELNTFFSSITGYVVVIVFLVINSLFLWVFPGELNVLDHGYATLDTLFFIAPWIFLFLAPAVTMKSFAEEKDKGTIELLYTRPLRDLEIITAKYLAALMVVLVSLIPTLIYFFSIFMLGSPKGNIDAGGTWGSFIGLFLLAAIYVAIGIFASSITMNQVVAFIIAMLLCFFMYTGFDFLSGLFLGKESFIINLGINAHYESVSRGVVDSRDLMYYLSAVVVFLYTTKLVLESRKW